MPVQHAGQPLGGRRIQFFSGGPPPHPDRATSARRSKDTECLRFEADAGRNLGSANFGMGNFECGSRRTYKPHESAITSESFSIKTKTQTRPLHDGRDAVAIVVRVFYQ